jgi:UDP-GlcNAc3NAcA epimerase
MLKILNIVGARPQIIKASAISRVILNNYKSVIEDIVVHTGQHYDFGMSEIFFREMQIPEPAYNLNVGSSSHGKQTAEMLIGLEKLIFKLKPNVAVIYGDTNSTLAAALAASKIHLPIIHVEAGLRSFNKKMPEEINRIVCDHVSTLLFSPTATAIQNLEREGFKPHSAPPYNIDNPGIFHCGDVMYDNSLYFKELAWKNSSILKDLEINNAHFVLLTLHRDNNTDDPLRLTSIFQAILELIATYHIDFIIPLHPRTRAVLLQEQHKSLFAGLQSNHHIRIISPVSYFDMIVLESNAELVMTDSGGVQKEAFFFKKPCIVLRPETEWKELIEWGTTLLADASSDVILRSFQLLINNKMLEFPSIFGEGKAAEFICTKIVESFQ